MRNAEWLIARRNNPQSAIGSRQDLLAALLLLCAVAFFLPNLTSYFLADDFVLLSWTHVTSLGDITGFFNPQTTWFYRPVVKLFYWAGQSIFGLHATPFHILSLLLHWANAYLVYRLVTRNSWKVGRLRVSTLRPSNLPTFQLAPTVTGLAAGLIFTLNPAHAETVSWIAAVGDLIGVFCILAALICFEDYCERGYTRYLLASLGLFVLGLLSRETAVILPALLLLDVVVFARWRLLSLRRTATLAGSYASILAAYLTMQTVGKAALPPSEAGQAPQLHMLHLDSILLGILDYVHRLVPGGTLLAQQPLNVLRVSVWVEWAALLLLAVWLWLAGRRLMLFGLGWTLVTPLVFIFFSPPTDRYMYLVSIGYAIFVGGLLGELLRVEGFWILTVPQSKIQNPKSKIQTAVVVLLLAALLLSQIIQLLDRESAWRSAGKATGGVFNDMKQAAPQPKDYTAFYFVDLPMTPNGIPTFLNTMPLAVQRIYDNPTLAASAVTCTYLRQTELPRYNFIFKYKGDGVRLLANMQECAN